MRNKRKNLGFTIIEIAVVLTISAILLTMASMSLSSSEKGNRDNERSADIEMLVQCLEDGYISTQEYVGTISDLEKCPKAQEAMTPPKLSTANSVLATNNSTTVTGVRPTPTKDMYVFQPLTATGALCTAPATTPCTNYNFFYYSELDGTIVKVSKTR